MNEKEQKTFVSQKITKYILETSPFKFRERHRFAFKKRVYVNTNVYSHFHDVTFAIVGPFICNMLCVYVMCVHAKEH